MRGSVEGWSRAGEMLTSPDFIRFYAVLSRVEQLWPERGIGLAGLLNAPGEGWAGEGELRPGSGVGGDDDAVSLKVRDVMVGGVAEHDRLAQHLEMTAGFVREVAADGEVVVEDEVVGDLAPGA